MVAGTEPVDDDDRLLPDGSPADRVWALLKEPDGIRWGTVKKLPARKRPQLIPVHDRVVRCAYSARAKFWSRLRPLFSERDGVLPTRLTAQRQAARRPGGTWDQGPGHA